MKRKRYTEEQIAFALRQAESGTTVAEVTRKMGISEQTFYRWKKKYAGMGVAELRRLKQLEEENKKLKQLVADLSLDKKMLQDVVQGNPEQIVRKLRDADAMLNAGKDLASVLQTLEVSESTYLRWRNQYGGMKSEEAKRLKQLEDENKRLKELVADLSLDNKMLKYISEGNW
jgi:putative transposase